MNYEYVYSYQSMIWDSWQSCKLKLGNVGRISTPEHCQPTENIMSL